MSREFMLSSGIHQGATFAVADELVLVGADPSCDICLSDTGLARRHLALVRRSNGVFIRALEGEVHVDGQVLAPNTQAAIPVGAEIALGESGVRIQFGAALEPPLPIAPLVVTKSASVMNRYKLSLVSIAVLLTTGVLAAGLSAGSLETSSGDVPDIEGVRALLQRENLGSEIELAKTAYGVELRGVIDAASAAKLRAVLTDAHVTNVAITDQELLDQVRDVFRINGYEVEVTYLGSAQVRIENLDEHHERVQRAAARVRTDVPLLRSLSFSSTEMRQPPERPTPYKYARGRRLTAQLSGQTAYLASDDGARYFAGSMLPEGHTVKLITEHAVLLDREGQLVWLGF